MEEFFIDSDGIKLHAKLERTEGVERCPLAIVLHGLTGHMEEDHIRAVAKAMLEVGVAVLRVELYGHGQSEGAFAKHTLYRWITNALDVIDYAKGLSWPTKLFLCGHSQGGYTTMLVGGMRTNDLAALIPLSPAIVIEYGARAGSMLGMVFDPHNIPDELHWDHPGQDGGYTFGGDYMRVAQTLHVREAIDRYHGPVLLVHGDADESVPIQYSIDAAKRYENAKLVVVEGDDHCFHHHLSQMTDAVKDFLAEQA